MGYLRFPLEFANVCFQSQCVHVHILMAKGHKGRFTLDIKMYLRLRVFQQTSDKSKQTRRILSV